MKDYQRPEIREIGSLQSLTLQNKDLVNDDGFLFQGNVIGNVS